MVFVNQVAEIVHRVVDQFLGAPSANLGQAFLLVWQFNHFQLQGRSKVADLSVMAFVQVVAALSRDAALATYNEHPRLKSKVPDFRVGVGFGLHLGWAIAGAIGSDFKIDATYLSPHVSLTAQLEGATSEYGVTMIMSDALVVACGPKLRSCFRPVDNVQMSSSGKATQLFTLDLEPRRLPADQRQHRRWRLHDARHIRERRRHDLLNPLYHVHQALLLDKNLQIMRRHLCVGFFQLFESGYLNYLAGEWEVASDVFARTRTMLLETGGCEDGPSRTLLEYMQNFGCQAPANWPGWRELKAAR